MIDAIPSSIYVGSHRVALHVAARSPTLAVLTTSERMAARRLSGRRRAEYVLGRAALKAASVAAGLGRDTVEIRMPHRQLSLTHAGGIAIAARGLADGALGIGVDWEPDRIVDSRATRFFLTDREAATPVSLEILLRLWTIKEALYKATPDNAKLTLRMFETAEPDAESGAARLVGDEAIVLRYATRRLGEGFLAAALAFAAVGPAAPADQTRTLR